MSYCAIDCGLDGDYMCIDGLIYGPCGADECGGACIYLDDCKCSCHNGLQSALSKGKASE